MGGENDLNIGVKREDQFDKTLLPFHMETHLRLVHEEDIRQVVLHEDGKEDGEHLLLTAGELIRHERLANLREAYLVLRAHNLLARLAEQVVNEVLEPLLRCRQLLRLLRCVGFNASISTIK